MNDGGRWWDKTLLTASMLNFAGNVETQSRARARIDGQSPTSIAAVREEVLALAA